MDLIGLKVVHKSPISTQSYGEGTIIEFNGDVFTVQFATKKVQFVYPLAFSKSIRAIDDSVQRAILGSNQLVSGKVNRPEIKPQEHLAETAKPDIPAQNNKAAETTTMKKQEEKIAPNIRSDRKNMNPELSKLFDELRLMEKDFLQKYSVLYTGNTKTYTYKKPKIEDAEEFEDEEDGGNNE